MVYMYLSLTIIFMALGVVTAGLNPLSIIDIPSVLIVFGPALASGCMVDGGNAVQSAVKDFIMDKKDLTPEQRNLNARIFRTMGNTAGGAGLVGVLIGAVAILRNLGTGDATAIGIGVAAALITALYGFGFKYLFCIPAEEKFK